MSTLRRNAQVTECPTGAELLGLSNHAQSFACVTDVRENLTAPVPFVVVETTGSQHQCFMNREDLVNAEAERGVRLRYMKNGAAAWHWSNLYAATEEQLSGASDHVCLLVGPMEQRGGWRDKFPIGCLAWMSPHWSPPGEVNICWLDFYLAMNIQNKTLRKNNTWHSSRRAAERHRAESQLAVANDMPERDGEPACSSQRQDVGGLLAQQIEESVRPRDEEDSELEWECIICMDAESE